MAIAKKKQSPLRAALDNERGTNYALAKQRKQEKTAARKKGVVPGYASHSKAANKAQRKVDEQEAVIESDEEDVAEANEELESGSESDDEDEENGGGLSLAAQIKKLAAAARKADPDRKGKNDAADEDEDEDLDEDLDDEEQLDEDDDSEEEDEDEDAQHGVSLKPSKALAQQEDEDEEEEDIPLSDLESALSDSADADIIPHQRLTINNTDALRSALARIALPTSTLPFSEHMSITSAEPTQIPDVDDDLTREQALYAQALDAATQGRTALLDEGVPFSRPADYFAEMLKTDEHMGKVRTKLVDAAARRKASQEARRSRDAKKFGKAVQQERLKERAAAKRAAMDGVNALKRKRGGVASGANASGKGDDDFGVGLENAVEAAARERTERRAGKGARGKDGEPNHKRQKKNEKFGFGGKKRHGKSNDATSTGDVRGFRGKGGSGGGGGAPGGRKPASGAARRPGKARRAKMK